jgi:hypothetical protein
MTYQTYRVVLTPSDGDKVRSIHYVDAHSHTEAKNNALLQQLSLDIEDGLFRQWAPIVIRPTGSAA